MSCVQSLWVFYYQKNVTSFVVVSLQAQNTKISHYCLDFEKVMVFNDYFRARSALNIFFFNSKAVCRIIQNVKQQYLFSDLEDQ